jgi:tetratricopeptide (TPR) repeat protein
LNDSAASATHRVEAGCMALMLLDQVCDQDAMPKVFKAIEKIAETPGVSIASRLQAKLVFHTTWGDLSVALNAARSLIEVQRSEGNVSDLLRALTNGPVAFRTAGLFEDAQSLLLEALAVANKHKLEVHIVDVYLCLANLELERGRFDAARRWFESIEGRHLEYNKHEQPREWTGVAARLALLSDRPSSARKFLPRNLQAIRNQPVAFTRAYGAALSVATELACGNVPSPELLSTLEDAHIQTRRAVYQAYPAYALHAGLKAAGRGTHASKRLAEYIAEFRRESYPPPAHFLNTFRKSKRLARQAGRQ